MKCVLRSIVPAAALALAASTACAQTAVTASIEQHGSGDAAAIDQPGNTGNAAAAIRQDGDANTATIRQSTLFTDLAAGAEASIEQAGSGNVASIDQTGSDMQGGSASQVGNGNRSTLVQHSGRAGAGSVQTGDGNVAELMFDTSRSGLSLVQTGNNNYGRVTMHDGSFMSVYATMTGESNLADIDQSGGQSDILTDQSGQYNALRVTQQDESFRGGNEVVVTQASDFNDARVVQFGSNFTATVVQDTGNGNSATVDQHF